LETRDSIECALFRPLFEEAAGDGSGVQSSEGPLAGVLGAELPTIRAAVSVIGVFGDREELLLALAPCSFPDISAGVGMLSCQL
jgi:hypothetical protein